MAHGSVGVVKVFWNESTTVDVEAFENLSWMS